MPIIEDDARDILAKAAKGTQLEPESLAAKSALSIATVLAAVGKNAYPKMRDIPDAAWTALAKATGLNATALLDIARDRYRPDVTLPGNLAQIITRHKHMEVNAWILGNPITREALLIDTGGDARPILGYLARNRWQATTLLLTHDHADHIAGLPELRAAMPHLEVFSPVLDHVQGTRELRPGMTLDAAGFSICCLSTAGHTDGGLSYFIADHQPPICFVGDALFAGSIGGARFCYQTALHDLRQNILNLPETTLLCSGHGPLTTLALESLHNPFLVTIL